MVGTKHANFRTGRNRISSKMILYLFLLGSINIQVDGLASDIRKILVCQNKDCCQRWTGVAASLPETLLDLLSDYDTTKRQGIEVETTSCLSKCGKGPNICITRNHPGADCYLHQVTNPTAAAIEIESSFSDVTVHSKLLAAVSCMEKSVKGMCNVEGRWF
jgi:predicted metal-binding protein